MILITSGTSIAEVSSAYPTSGGMYFTLKYLAPPKYTPIISWYVGWLNLIGQICGSASSVYGAAQMLLAVISIGSDFSYYPTQGHVIGVMAALTVLHAAINSLSTAWLHRMASTYAVVHIAILLAAWVALLVLQKEKNSASYVFTKVEPASGWTPAGFSFLFGFLSVSWTMTDYDAAAHIAEEVKDPARTVPKAIAAALSFTYIVGFIFTIILAFCMGSPSEILASPIGQPVVQIFFNVLGKAPAIVFGLGAFLIMTMVSVTAMQAGSRTLWSFARDEMIPGAKVWNKIWKRTDTPVLAVWFYAFMCIAINLIGLGSYVTIAAIFNVCAIALDWSYCIPIICKLVFGRFEPGPWNLGKFSKPLNIYACCWTAFVSVIFMFPTIRPVDAENVSFTPSQARRPVRPFPKQITDRNFEQMNYAVVIIAFVMLIATVYWYIRGRKYYVGPRVTAHVHNGGIIPVDSEDEKTDPERSPAGHQAQPALS